MNIIKVLAEDRHRGRVTILEQKSDFENGNFCLKSFRWYWNEADAREAFEAAIKPTRKKRMVKHDTDNKRRS